MNQDTEPNNYLNSDNLKPKKVVAEIKYPTPSVYVNRVNVQKKVLEKYRQGKYSWWIVIRNWILLSVPIAIFIWVAINAILDRNYILAIFPLLLASLLASILWRRTSPKLNRKRRRRR